MHILTLCGSLRSDSWNRFLLDLLEQRLTDLGHELDRVSAAEMAAVPHYSPEHDGEGAPAPVVDLRRRIGAAETVVIATPTYNLGLPSALKALVDWGSRPYGSSAFHGSRLAVIASGNGRTSGTVAAEHLTTAFGLIFQATIVDPVVVVPSITHRVTDGVPDAELLSQLDTWRRPSEDRPAARAASGLLSAAGSAGPAPPARRTARRRRAAATGPRRRGRTTGPAAGGTTHRCASAPRGRCARGR